MQVCSHYRTIDSQGITDMIILFSMEKKPSMKRENGHDDYVLVNDASIYRRSARRKSASVSPYTRSAHFHKL